MLEFRQKGSDTMAGATTSMTIRMNREVKEESQKLFRSLGLDMTTAINLFLRQSLQHQGLPFEVRLEAKPSEKFLRALAEAEKEPTYGPFATVKETMEALDADD